MTRRASAARVLIKIASTWEGIRAAEQLERGGVSSSVRDTGVGNV
jgi:transaldolase